MREIKTPIVCWCSHGDNITPPQQALDWILDNYQSVGDIQECGQRIFYAIDPKVGHLAIFVGTKVAAKNHAEFINNMELIDAMPPGLYEIVITEKPDAQASTQGEAVDFDLSIEDRSPDDIRALGCNSLHDEREFAAAARVSDLNNALYQTFLQPWIKIVSGPQVAAAVIELNPAAWLFAPFRQELDDARSSVNRHLCQSGAHPRLDRQSLHRDAAAILENNGGRAQSLP